MGAIERVEDLVRRHCGRRDAQGNVRTLAEDTRTSSLEALLPDDLEKHVQLMRARLNSYGVLREEIKTYCEGRGHANARNTKQKGPSHPAGDPMDIGAFGKGKDNQGNRQSIGSELLRNLAIERKTGLNAKDCMYLATECGDVEGHFVRGLHPHPFCEAIVR